MNEEERLTRAREELTEVFLAKWKRESEEEMASLPGPVDPELLSPVTDTSHGELALEYADALLPVVDRIARQRASAVLRAAAQEQRNEAETVPDTDEGTHADGHRCAAEFLDRRADVLDRNIPRPGHGDPGTDTKGPRG